MSDDDIIRLAWTQRRILITNDTDFGEKIYRDHQPHCGVVLMRLADERVAAKISVMKQLLENYENRLAGQFVVVTDEQVRFGRR